MDTNLVVLKSSGSPIIEKYVQVDTFQDLQSQVHHLSRALDTKADTIMVHSLLDQVTYSLMNRFPLIVYRDELPLYRKEHGSIKVDADRMVILVRRSHLDQGVRINEMYLGDGHSSVYELYMNGRWWRRFYYRLKKFFTEH